MRMGQRQWEAAADVLLMEEEWAQSLLSEDEPNGGITRLGELIYQATETRPSRSLLPKSRGPKNSSAG